MNSILQLQFPILWGVTGGLLLLTGVLLWAVAHFDYWDFLDSWRGFCAFLAIIFTSIAVIATLISMVPFSAKYWTINYVSGTVASASNQFTDGTGNLVGDYIITLDGDSTQYLATDSRLTTVRPGDHVDMACTVQWNYGGVDSNNCDLAEGGPR